MTKTTELPMLPEGYKWEMIHQVPQSSFTLNTSNKWIVRISWTMRSGKHRMLNLKDLYFDTRGAALAHGAQAAKDHLKKQRERLNVA
jgi:hypothetical protein